MPEHTTMNSHVAAELLRGYAPAATSLPDCLTRARAKTANDPVRAARVELAARVLGLH